MLESRSGQQQTTGIRPGDPRPPEDPVERSLHTLRQVPGVLSAERFTSSLRNRKPVFNPNIVIERDPETTPAGFRTRVFVEVVDSTQEAGELRVKVNKYFQEKMGVGIQKGLIKAGWLIFDASSSKKQASALSEVGITEKETAERLRDLFSSHPNFVNLEDLVLPKYIFGIGARQKATVQFTDETTRDIYLALVHSNEEMKTFMNKLIIKFNAQNEGLQVKLAQLGIVTLDISQSDKYLRNQWDKKMTRIIQAHNDGTEIRPEEDPKSLQGR